MLSQLTRQRILENAKKQALENSLKVEEVKTVVVETKDEEEQKSHQKKKTDAEKLKKRD